MIPRFHNRPWSTPPRRKPTSHANGRLICDRERYDWLFTYDATAVPVYEYKRTDGPGRPVAHELDGAAFDPTATTGTRAVMGEPPCCCITPLSGVDDICQCSGSAPATARRD